MKDYYGKDCSLLKDKKLWLFDMDGTVYLGNRLFDGTTELLEKITSDGGKYVFITNNSSKGIEDYVKKVTAMGIKADESEVRELLSTLGIADRLNSLPCQLSGGQRQRAAIARALITKPHLILADEPTGNLDSKNSLEVTRTLISLNERFGQTIVLVTHNEGLAQMAGRLIRIEDGRIVSDTNGGAR